MKDDSAKEKALDKLLAEKLRAQAAPAGACPEAGTLAAYVERQLAPRERSKWETHFASCARCQEQIAALVRLSEEDEPEPVQIPMRRPIARYRWAWVAPALLAVTVAGLWYVGELPSGLKQNAENAPFSEPAQTAAPPAASEQEQTFATESAAKKQHKKSPAVAQTLKKEKRAAAQAASASAPAAPARKVLNAERRASGQDVLSANIGRQAQAPRPAAEELKPAAQPSPGAPTAAPQVAAQAVAIPSERAEIARQEQTGGQAGVVGGMSGVALAPAAKSAPATTAQKIETASRQALMQSYARTEGTASARSGFHYARPGAVGAANLVSKPLWRVGPHGLIQELSQGSWVTRPSDVSEDLLDVTFPSAQAGWIVGRHGTILRSTDAGRTWQRIPSPTEEDLVHVRAESADSAQVSTHGGKEYTTTDGGKTWHAVSPQ